MEEILYEAPWQTLAIVDPPKGDPPSPTAYCCGPVVKLPHPCGVGAPAKKTGAADDLSGAAARSVHIRLSMLVCPEGVPAVSPADGPVAIG